MKLNINNLNIYNNKPAVAFRSNQNGPDTTLNESSTDSFNKKDKSNNDAKREQIAQELMQIAMIAPGVTEKDIERGMRLYETIKKKFSKTKKDEE